jgi:hypothetical protein
MEKESMICPLRSPSGFGAYRKILDPRYVVHTELYPDYDFRVFDALLASKPGTYTLTTTGLVGILAAGVLLTRVILCDVDVVVYKLGSLVVETVCVG